MYFWKINDLKRLIVERGLSETQVFYYLLLFVGLSAASIELIAYFPATDPNAWNYLDSILNLVIPIVGTIAAYHANHGAAGKNFAAKYLSIGFVISIRFLVYLIPLIIVFLFSSPEEESDWFEIVLFAAWYVVMYARIVKHIRDTAV
jgi:hypothetical protein